MQKDTKINRLKHTQSQMTNLDFLGKVPPQAIELEEAVLGAIMLESSSIDLVISILTPEAFYKEANKNIYEAILSLNKSHNPIDIYTVIQELKKQNNLENVGGAQFVSGLTLKVGSAANIEYHAKIIAQKYIQREIIRTSSEMQQRAFDESSDVSDLITDAERDLNGLSQQIALGAKSNHISVSANTSYEGAEKRVNNVRKGVKNGIHTGLIDLDKFTNGWKGGNLIVLAARPSLGKTSLLQHFTLSAAKQNIDAVVFSIEMSAVGITNRLIISESGVDPERFSSGYMTDDELNKVANATVSVSKLPIHIVDNSDATMSQIRARARLLHKQGKCKIVLIDYLQRIKGKHNDSWSKNQIIGEMIIEAKSMARELNIPVIMLSQLNRGVEGRAERKPMLSDLRESGDIEQEADIVMFIYRPEYYGIKAQDEFGNIEENYGELLIEKNRDGATGKVRFKHSKGLMNIYDYNKQVEPPQNSNYYEPFGSQIEPNVEF